MRLRAAVLACAIIVLLLVLRHFLMNLLILEKTCALKERIVPRSTRTRMAAALQIDFLQVSIAGFIRL